MSKATFCTIEQAQKAAKHRVSSWFDTDKMEARHGIEALMSYALWAHVADYEEKSILLFDNKQQAKAFIATVLRAPQSPLPSEREG